MNAPVPGSEIRPWGRLSRLVRGSPLLETCPVCRGFICFEDVGVPPARSVAELPAHAIIAEAAECGCELELHSCVRERSLLRRTRLRLLLADPGVIDVTAIRTCERHGASRVVFERRFSEWGPWGPFFGSTPRAKARARAEVHA